MTTAQPYHIRPGRLSDVPPAVDIYMAAFGHDQLIDILFPNHREYPSALATYARRMFYCRWWSVNWDLQILVDNTSGSHIPVGFTWWKRPTSRLSFYERWISPHSLVPVAWLAPLVQVLFSLRDWLFPIPHLNQHAANTFSRSFTKTIEPQIINTPRRKSAWYLSTLAVLPSLQGKRLGTALLQHGLQRADQSGAATWLICLEGLDNFYEKYGYVEVARANVGEMEHWNGGALMFRKE